MRSTRTDGTARPRTAISIASLLRPGPCASNLIESALADAYANSGAGGAAQAENTRVSPSGTPPAGQGIGNRCSQLLP